MSVNKRESNGWRFFVLEDDVIVASFISGVIRSCGQEVAGIAYDAKTAESLIRTLEPDIVFVDIHLGDGKDGIAFARNLRKFHPETLLVFITAYDDDPTLESALSLQPISYLLKPFDERDLKVVIRMAMEKANRKNIKRKTNLSGLKEDAVKERVERVLLQEKKYLESELSLTSLAEATGVTVHQLSEFLNRVMGVTFHDLINRLRVEEAIRMIQAKPHMSLLRIGFEVGFNSRSTFHRVFRHSMGVSPEEYRKTVKESE